MKLLTNQLFGLSGGTGSLCFGTERTTSFQHIGKNTDSRTTGGRTNTARLLLGRTLNSQSLPAWLIQQLKPSWDVTEHTPTRTGHTEGGHTAT